MPHAPRTLSAVLPLSLVLAAGCSNPLASEPGDYGQQIPIERLRRIEAMQIKQYTAANPPEGQAADTPAQLARDRFKNLPEVSLSIAQARASALEHNLDLQVALVNPTIAKLAVDEEEARFEAAFTTQALWRHDDAPSIFPNFSEGDTQLLEPGVRVPLRSGGTATVSLPMARNEPGGSDAQYSSDLAFSISQPLLRNAGREVNTTAIRIANYNRQISEAQTKLAIINQIAEVERGYWRLYGARRNLDVAQQQYELAVAQLQSAERIVRSGKQPEIEVTRAQSGVANRLDEIIVAQNTVLSRQREFKRIINMPGLEVDGDTSILIATDPDPVEYIVNAPTLIEQAIANRMDLLEFELRLLADAANIKFNENQTLPQLDLAATYRIAGIGGTAGDSFDSLARNKFEAWTIGANLDVPIGNEGAKSRLRQSVLTRLQRLGSRDARRLVVRQEVSDAVDRIQAGWQRILATRQATILSARTLRAEQRQFDVGGSTTTNVLDASTRLAIAQLQEINAIVDYQIAQIDLAAATGTTLGATRILWDPAAPDKGRPDTITQDGPDAVPPPAVVVTPGQNPPPPEPVPAELPGGEPQNQPAQPVEPVQGEPRMNP